VRQGRRFAATHRDSIGVEDPRFIAREHHLRFIGNIIVKVKGKEADANLWLCEQGWAFPTFYSSMMNDEISELITLGEKARKNKSGIWGKVTSDLTMFDPKLLFRSHGAPNAAQDKGPVIMPKLFRRQSTFAIAKLPRSALVTFLTLRVPEPSCSAT